MNAKQLIAISALAFLGSNAAFAQEATPDTWMNAESTKTRSQVQAEAASTDRAVLQAGEATVLAAPSVGSSAVSRGEVRAEADRFGIDPLNIGA